MSSSLKYTAAAASVLLLLSIGSCSPDDRGTSGPGEEPEKPNGEPDQLTSVDPSEVTGLDEREETSDEGPQIDVSYPEIPNADPLTQRLDDATSQKVSDFTSASADAESLTIDWDISVATEDVVAVRLVQEEKDSDGERTSYTTYWYDATSGHTAYSTELVGNQEDLAELDSLVKDSLNEEQVDASTLHPILHLYDSMGFNPDGDLVVEFDQGQIAPAGAGRVNATIPKEDVTSLLSDLGERAQSAATNPSPGSAVEDSATPPKDDTADGSVPGRLPERDDSVDCSSAAAKCIALTFDDGPGARTPELLDALAEYNAKATFFLTGQPAREHPETVRREYAEGHELANHTVTHSDLTTLDKSEVREELTTVNALVRRETGYTLDLMRPPYGATNDKVAQVSRSEGLAEIIWSVDTNDWKNRNAGKVRKEALKNAKPGSIVLMHDIHGTTIDAVPDILERLEEQGYTMVTISQLLGETEPGESYYNGHPDEDGEE
ncbi:polysaccharide deacetylase family protein [Haloactinospora alba]|uniref:polysaccharide deacetylase family protein n=1 Tax=Haloactinospora alba TaxID=405555 RepID=UPI001FEB6236|nr:polysaccharide deacetylase family protein [Haloactinospora alba]